MSRKLVLLLCLSAVLAVAIAALASAASVTVRSGNVLVTLGGNVSPKAMPKNRYVPVKTKVFGRIATSDRSHPPALREVVVDIDKDAKVNGVGYPVCKPGQLEARNTEAARRVCGRTSIGSGLAHAEIAFPEQGPIRVTSPITVFNGGKRGGKTLLLVHTFLTVPVPAAIVTRVTIQKKGPGLRAVARIPVIAGGSGSATDFKFRVGKTYRFKSRRIGYFEAKCPDGRFRVSSPKILLRNEAQTPGIAAQTRLDGSFLAPCTPKG
jgi:hypothetical protein